MSPKKRSRVAGRRRFAWASILGLGVVVGPGCAMLGGSDPEPTFATVAVVTRGQSDVDLEADSTGKSALVGGGAGALSAGAVGAGTGAAVGLTMGPLAPAAVPVFAGILGAGGALAGGTTGGIVGGAAGSARREGGRLASELGVDVHSSNAVLQTDLDDVSWSIFAGGASVDLAMTQAPRAAGLSMTAVEAIDGAHSPLWDIPPATLRQASSDALQAMGLSSDEGDAIAWHSACTLTHQTALVSFLAELTDVGGRDEFARLAASAGDEADCRFYVETAKLVWTYHRQRRPVETLSVADGVVSMKDADGRFVLPLRADYVFWTPEAKTRIDALPASGRRTLWLSGTLSERTRGELGQRKIAVDERVFERHPAEVDVAAVLAPARAETADEEGDPN